MPPEARAGFLLAFALEELWSTFADPVDFFLAEETDVSSNSELTSSLDSVDLGFLGISQILCLLLFDDIRASFTYSYFATIFQFSASDSRWFIAVWANQYNI